MDDDLLVDAQAVLARQLVRYSRPVGQRFVKSVFWLRAYLGEDADEYINEAMEYKDRQAVGGGRRSIVDALRAIALYDQRQAGGGGGLAGVLGGLLGRR